MMRRRAGLPVGVRRRLDLAHRERVLGAAGLAANGEAPAGAEAADGPGGWLVGTDRALLVAPDGQDVRRVPWHEIDRARWGEDAILRIERVDGEVLVLAVADERAALVGLLRERVQRSVVHTHRVPGTGRGVVRVVLRRVSPGDELIVQILADPGTPLSDPAVARRVNDAVQEVRGQVGLPAGGAYLPARSPE